VQLLLDLPSYGMHLPIPIPCASKVLDLLHFATQKPCRNIDCGPFPSKWTHLQDAIQTMGKVYFSSSSLFSN
jgi:hypothetical protein